MAFPEAVRVDGQWLIDCPAHGLTVGRGFGGPSPVVKCGGKTNGRWCAVGTPLPANADGKVLSTEEAK